MTLDARAHAEELRATGSAFVFATVVRAERPTSAKPGAHAVVHADGTMVGFVGGECAEASVRVQALATLETGEPVLLRIMPNDPSDGTAQQSAHDGVMSVHNPCLSGGTLEVFLEPTLAVRRMIVHGESPIAVAFAELARHLGYDVETDTAQSSVAQSSVGESPVAVLVSSHGDDEGGQLVAAIRSGVPYVGLVASRRRGPEVLAALDLTDDEKARIHTPAGLDIKARTPQDVAISIMAEIIATREAERAAAVGVSTDAEPARGAATTAATAIDPVCGMTVATVDATPHLDVLGVRYWFCREGCRDAFAADPAAFARA
jgi:xanthine dehydrogenase accessory factor